MLTYQLTLWLTVFIAAFVEMIEALTIILALGVSRSWRSALIATAAALATLGVLTAVFIGIIMQVTDEKNLPLRPLWIVVGGLLLIFGLQWLKKSILRIGGILASRDEDQIHGRLVRQSKKAPKHTTGSIDWYCFTLVYKGVLLEGFEVVFIVVTFGAARGQLGVGVTAALAALVVVGLLGLLTHKPLRRIPENWMKFVVGLLLTTFGTFFVTEGMGMIWPLGDWALFYVAALYGGISFFAMQFASGSPKSSRLKVGVKA